MQKNPSIYLIMLTWNDKASVLEAIDSVLLTEYPNYRLVVVDNNSSDGTQEAIREKYTGEQLHFIENDDNLRFSGGNNVGIRWALEQGADYICLLNNDITVDSGMVGKMAEAALDTDAGMVGPMMYYYPPRGEGNEVIWYAGGKIRYWLGYISHRGIRKVDRGQYSRVEDVDYISGCVLMVRRDVIEDIGLLDPDYIYGEDTDWCIRASRAGYRLVFAPEARMWHKVSMSSGGGLSAYKVYYRTRSTLLLFRRHARPWHWITMPLAVSVAYLIFLAGYVLTGRFSDARALILGLFVPKKGA